jgi:exopolyphosphatase/guanosine-5'-triphosphate,3'-diphosphate pyrophosphatase
VAGLELTAGRPVAVQLSFKEFSSVATSMLRSYPRPMREAVLDVGSNTAHLLVVDAHRGAAPLPALSVRQELRLAEQLTPDGALSDAGVDALVSFISAALDQAEDQGCESVMAFATSAIREASNTDEVLKLVRDRTGVDIKVLSGEEEAMLTFLAVRRWFGWSSGRLAVFDIGGGSLEIATGADEVPEVAMSFELGAGRLTRERLSGDVPGEQSVRDLRKYVRARIARGAGIILRAGSEDYAVATSKTFRSLARICGAAPSSEGPYVHRALARSELAKQLPKIAKLSAGEIAKLPGVSAGRAHQLVAGAIVAEAVMDIFNISELRICPWALREGVILQYLDQLSESEPIRRPVEF